MHDTRAPRRDFLGPLCVASAALWAADLYAVDHAVSRMRIDADPA